MRNLLSVIVRILRERPRLRWGLVGAAALLVVALLFRPPSWVVKVGPAAYGGKIFVEDRLLSFSDLPFGPGEASLGVETASRVFLAHWIEERLILTRARELKLKVDDIDAERRLQETKGELSEEAFQLLLVERKIPREALVRKAREELLMKAVLEKEVPSPAAVSDQEVEAYYREHRSEFFRPAQIRALQMTIPTEDEMASVMQAIEEGRSFEQLMVGKRVQGGDMGYFSQGEMPLEFDAVLFSLKVGEVSQPVRTPYGYHLFEVVDLQEARPLGLPEASARIREKLTSLRKVAAEEQWLAELRKRYEVKINRRHPALKGLFSEEDKA
jgi:peptidyl-prolyl cis-trans isomerase C